MSFWRWDLFVVEIVGGFIVFSISDICGDVEEVFNWMFKW